MTEYKWASVAAVRAESYEAPDLQEKVNCLLEQAGLSQLLKPGMKITIKANLLMKRRPEEATTTHPAIVAAVVRFLQGKGIQDITIADSPGGPYSLPLLRGIYEASGMTQVSRDTGAALNEDVTWETVSAVNGKKCSSFSIIAPVKNADLVISIGKLKSHCMTTLSGGVKNLFGCIPGLQKPELHCRFSEKREFCGMLVDLAQAMAPALTIMDAIVGMEGDGPSAGTPIHSGFLAASTSPFVLDRYLCGLIGFAPEETPTVAESIARGLCPADTEEITLIGDSMPEQIPFRKPASQSVDFISRVPAPLKPAAHWIKNHFLTPGPVIDGKKCIGCGRCAQNCPAKTIEIVGGKAQIHRADCIRCYCCHEMCPVKAISVRRLRLFDL